MMHLIARFAPIVSLLTCMSLALLGIAGQRALAQGNIRAVGEAVETLALEVNKGALVRLSQPAAAVFVANPEYADISVKSPTLVYVTGRRTGETSLFALNARDDILANIVLQVTHNLAGLQDSFSRVLPDTRIEARTVPGGLMISGLVNSPREAEEANRIAANYLAADEVLVNQLQVIAPNQVNLRVRVAEISRETLKRLGFNFDALGASGGFAFGLATGRGITAVSGGLSRLGSSNAATVGAGFSSGNVDINGIIDALETEGLVTLLAEPNLTALSGETASFLAGGEFPVPVPGGDNGISIEFKPFGVQLAFTPTILDGGRISLRVLPEVSSLTTSGSVNIQGFVIPALSTRRTSTTVELASGQSFAVAGLMKADSNQAVEEVPGLADIPVIGSLFRSTNFQRAETELVVIITPYLVRPVATALAAPTDGFQVPDDFDRVIHGETQRRKVAPSRTGIESNAPVRPAGVGGFAIGSGS